MQYRYSRDPKVAAAGIEVHTGRKWNAARELQVAEARLRQKALVGTVASGRTGLGYFPSFQVSKAKGKERLHLLQEEVRAGAEEEWVSQMVGLSQQGAWTRWENTQQRKITWSDFWQVDFYHIRFLVQVVYDTLPSPTNTHGAKLKHLSALSVLGEGLFNISSAAAPKPWPMDATAGATIRCSRQLRKQSPKKFNPANNIRGRVPSLS